MRIGNLRLENFRNYPEQEFFFSPHITILSGGNAQGKTNVLEALYLLAVGRSHRMSGEKDLVREGTGGFRLQLDLERNQVKHRVQASYSVEQGKGLRVDQKAYRNRLGGVVTGLQVVLFAPEDLELVKGAPALRRRFLDEQVFIGSGSYRKTLNRFNRALSQRNRVLKDYIGQNMPPELISSWDKQLVESGCELIRERARAVRELAPVACAMHQELSGGTEDLLLDYRPSVEADAQGYFQRLQEKRVAERARGISLVGPHRDDLSLQIDGLELRSHGSQGQQRCAVLALKVAVREEIRKREGVMPVLLLDDVLSELDVARQRRLLAVLGKENQTIITCTDKEMIVRSPSMQRAHLYEVERGLARRVQ